MPELTTEEIKKMVEEAVQNSTEGLVIAITAAVSQTVATTINCSVQLAVTTAMDSYEHECVLDFEPEEVRAVKKLVDACASLGDHGDLRDGVSQVRDSLHFIKKAKARIDKIGGAMLMGIVTAVVGVIILIFSLGTKKYFE